MEEQVTQRLLLLVAVAVVVALVRLVVINLAELLVRVALV
jgi:hypothetical protein